MTVKDFGEGKLIILSKPFDTRAKYLNFFYFLLFFTAASILAINAFQEPSGLVYLLLAGIIICLVVAYRFLNKTLESEKLILDKKNLQLVYSGLFNYRRKAYELAEISQFRHLEKPELTKHPLAGVSFDYLGFQTEQAVINEMHGDNRLAFSYLEKTVSFGQNVSSWEFEQLEVLIYEITGNDLRYADITETELKSKN